VGSNEIGLKTIKLLAQQLAPEIKLIIEDEHNFILAMYKKLSNFTKSIDLLIEEYSLGNLYEVTNILTMDVYNELSYALKKLALGECDYPEYEQLRLTTMKSLAGLYKAVLKNSDLINAEEQLIKCKDRVAILSDPEKLKEHIESMKKNTVVFPESTVQAPFARLKPQYSEYIRRYGFPEGGIFNPDLLGQIIDELTTGRCQVPVFLKPSVVCETCEK
jgi:hypothetical protein